MNSANQVIKDLLNVMEIQEKRDTEEFHLSIEAFYPMWVEAMDKAKAYLKEDK